MCRMVPTHLYLLPRYPDQRTDQKQKITDLRLVPTGVIYGSKPHEEIRMKNQYRPTSGNLMSDGS